ncbi:Metallo-beta-lactamase superfamily [Propionibacterium ruminifibrarum]|uniref:Metallo-beta-lactamase superfamily n=1 Tax=Propionibacterium ruminifibrarum TaxID=1962131 RepID=A0A375I1X1_9ACTN|nr:MBL fold metallo-hydrolase [Propionibacterium ruminifibrarum]SPF68647.1 Metallo-beta-lactamase superfamily [Propionibacterium ruminifibrarum]
MIRTIFVTDVFTTNCYVSIDPATGHGFLVDPGAEGRRLAETIRRNDWTIEYVVLTHGHFDHTGGIEALLAEMPIPVLAYQGAEKYLTDTHMNLSAYCDRNVVVPGHRPLHDGDRIRLQANPGFFLDVIGAPGHTEDSTLFLSGADRACFVGDTIFKGSLGNPGYPGGNADQLLSTIAQKIFTLPPDTVLYSGHSEPTTVEAEAARYR